MQPAARWAAALLLLGVAVATVPAHPTPSVMEIKHGWKPRAKSASVASAQEEGYNEGYYEEKEVCLQEVTRRDCSSYWYQQCENESDCGNPIAIWTTDVACCHKDGYTGYGHSGNNVGDHLWGPHNSIGSCDWTANYVTDNEDPAAVTNNIAKYGSASAICYFGADSQECGGPFCERMVVTLEGAFYYVDRAYSYGTSTNTNTDECVNVEIWPDFANFDPIPRLGNRTDNTPASRRQAMKDGKRGRKAQNSAKVASTGADASAQYYHGNDRAATTATVYGGSAYVINGAVTAMVGPKKDKWENGLFEYTLDFFNEGGPQDNIDASWPWVMDKTYKFTFYKDTSYYQK